MKNFLPFIFLIVAFCEAIAQDFPNVLVSQNCVELDLGPSVQSENKNLLYQWDFGDGQQAIGVIAEHCYETLGEYTATLTVTDPYSATSFKDEYEVRVYITPDIQLEITIQGSLLTGVLKAKDDLVSDVQFYWDTDGQYYTGDSISVTDWNKCRLLARFKYANQLTYMSKTISNE